LAIAMSDCRFNQQSEGVSQWARSRQARLSMTVLVLRCVCSRVALWLEVVPIASDSGRSGEAVAGELGIDRVVTEVVPADTAESVNMASAWPHDQTAKLPWW
jgi:hypothetical protein